MQLLFKIVYILKLTAIQKAFFQVIKWSLYLQVLTRSSRCDGQGTEPVVGGKFKVLTVEYRPTGFPAVNARFLIIALDLTRHTVQVDKGINKCTKQGFLLLVINHLDVLLPGVAKDIAKEGYLLSFA